MKELKNNPFSENTCFVIMGYGEKNDYPRSRTINLDKTYENIIKPAVEASGYICVRCDEIKHSGLIDVQMYKYLLFSELVIADISTLNANALYELGVRHGVRPFTTIILAQNDEEVPFNTDHINVFRYEHLGTDIGCTEAKRAIKELISLINKAKENSETDSPFYTYMGINNLSELYQEKDLVCITNVKNKLHNTILTLIGQWDDSNLNDLCAIKKLAEIQDDSIFITFFEYSKLNKAPLQYQAPNWKFSRTKDSLVEENISLTLPMLKNFKDLAIEVLSEIDPKYDLEKEKRFAAQVYGKVSKYSKSLRRGIAETLVFLSFHENTLLQELDSKYLIQQIIRTVLSNNNWKLWASLNDLLPIFAEAAPIIFIDVIREHLKQNKEMFIELIRQEGDGITGGSLISGILWSLELITWFPDCFLQAIQCLLKLAEIDIGGTYSNRPITSIKTLLLPWINTTQTDVETKITSLERIISMNNEFGWQIITSLLPELHSVTWGTRKPTYHLESLEGYEKDVSIIDYEKQINYYSEKLISLAKEKDERILFVLEHLKSVNKNDQDQFFEYLEKRSFSELTENLKYQFWDQLNILIRRHKKFRNSSWAYMVETVDRIEDISKKIKPKNIFLLYRPLFSNYEYDLDDAIFDVNATNNWETLRKEIQVKRENAINEMIDVDGLSGIINFIDNEVIAINTSAILASKKSRDIDLFLFPNYFNSENDNINHFIKNYIRTSSYQRDSSWVEDLNVNNWTLENKILFITSMKFESDTWEFAKEILEKDENAYWENVDQNMYASDSELIIPIKKFLEVGKEEKAIECISISIFNKKEIETELILNTLENYIQNPNNSPTTLRFVEIFKFLEKNQNTDKEKLWIIEYYYYSLFTFQNTDIPKTLYDRVSSDPELYVEIASFALKEDGQTENIVLSDSEKVHAQLSFNILSNFNMIPGLDESGNINHESFQNWLTKVLQLSRQKKRELSIKRYIGKLLYNSPEDRNGFWIDEYVARELDKFENDEMLDGYSSAIHNSRGWHTVDTTGNTEKELANSWLERASALRQKNFDNFAAQIDKVAQYFFDLSEDSKKNRNFELL